MANYDPYEREYSRRYVREERRDDRDARFHDARDYPKPYPSRELVPRGREDSDLSIEEVRRDFPPPSTRDLRRARSAEPGYYEADYDYRRGYDARYERDYDRPPRRGPAAGSAYYEDDHRRSKHKSMSKQEKIIAAVAGAALLVGGKELYDRHEAKSEGLEVQRNPLSSAALAGFGALAGYQGAEYYSKQQAKKDQTATYILHRGRDGYVSEYYSDDDVPPREKRGHKNFLESAIAATGLGAAVKSLTGGGSDTRSRHGDSPGSYAGSRSGSRGPTGTNKIQQAAMASLLAGATEAFRVAKEPGGWKGEKTKRILTAAAGAATVDAAQRDDKGTLGLAESVIGGLVGNRLINGSKKDIEEDRATGRSRSRSRAPSSARAGGSGGSSGLAALATAGLGALGAKKVLDSSRSHSRGRDYDSRSPSPDRRRQRSRSRSVVDKARNSLAKLGIGSGASEASEDYRRRDQDDFDDRASSRRSRRYSDDMYDNGRESHHGRDRGDYEQDRHHRRRDSPRRRGSSRSGYGTESDLGDSDEDAKRAKKMKGKQIITTGLATVATIHAAHGIYQSMEKRRVRQRAVREGRLSPEEAKRLKTKAVIQDAASVGIAALGIKGAISEMKEAKELTHECKKFEQEKARRHERRLEQRVQERVLQRQALMDRDRRSDSMPASRSRSRYWPDSESDDYGPQYFDDNPYAASRLPAPPMGRGG